MLDEALSSAFEKLAKIRREQVLLQLVLRKLGAEGIRLSPAQVLRLKRWVSGNLKAPAPRFRHKGLNQKFEIDITSREQRRIFAHLKRSLADDSGRLTLKAITSNARPFLRLMRAQWEAEIDEFERPMIPFLKRLRRVWKKPLALLRLQLHLARSVAAQINDELRASPSRRKGPLIEVQTRLHARLCQIGAEVLHLLEFGFSEAAMSRWRSQHEVHVVLRFIQMNGPGLAKRYLAHEVVETWRGAEEYMKHCGRLGYAPMEAAELAQLKQEFAQAVSVYGRPFAENYGWAAAVLFPKRATLSTIEDAAGLAHLRPDYRRASHSTHSNPKGLTQQLGMMPGTDYLPTGPSNYGLAIPGQNTALTLAQGTAMLVATAQTADRALMVEVMKVIADAAAEAFERAQMGIELREKKLRGQISGSAI